MGIEKDVESILKKLTFKKGDSFMIKCLKSISYAVVLALFCTLLFYMFQLSILLLKVAPIALQSFPPSCLNKIDGRAVNSCG